MSPFPGDGRHRLAAIAAVMAGSVLLYLSGSISHSFGQILGTTERDRALLGTVGVALIACKAILPFGLYAAWRQARWLLLGIGTMAWVCAVAYSLTSSFGYGAAQRERAEATSFMPQRIKTKLAELPDHRPAATIEPLLKSRKLSRDERAKLESELGTAKEATSLEAQLAIPATTTASAQVADIASVAALDPTTVKVGLLGILALAMEFCEASLFMLASLLWWGSAPTKARVNAPQTDTKPVMTQAAPPQAEPIKGQRQTLAVWIGAYLDAAKDSVTAGHAYDDYVAEWGRRRRKPAVRAKFLKALDKIAIERGAQRSQAAGRVAYKVAA